MNRGAAMLLLVPTVENRHQRLYFERRCNQCRPPVPGTSFAGGSSFIASQRLSCGKGYSAVRENAEALDGIQP